MTGYGEARYQSDALNLSLELRAVNNRYLKVTLRTTDPYHLLEPEFEKVIRRVVKRGTLQVHLRLDRQGNAQDYRINHTALESYVQQLRGMAEQLGLGDRGDLLLGQVLALPGVVPEAGGPNVDLHEDWPLLEKVLVQALERLQA